MPGEQRFEVFDGNLALIFSLWDAETGGNRVWAESKAIAVTSTTRIIKTMLGDGTPYSQGVTLETVDFSQQLWVQVEVYGAVIGTREKLSVVSYALWSSMSNVPGVPGPQGPQGLQGEKVRSALRDQKVLRGRKVILAQLGLRVCKGHKARRGRQDHKVLLAFRDHRARKDRRALLAQSWQRVARRYQMAV